MQPVVKLLIVLMALFAVVCRKSNFQGYEVKPSWTDIRWDWD